ncbi:putative reverse transcriptase domain-containing protein, partial [Tanacetum coccineum]
WLHTVGSMVALKDLGYSTVLAYDPASVLEVLRREVDYRYDWNVSINYPIIVRLAKKFSSNSTREGSLAKDTTFPEAMIPYLEKFSDELPQGIPPTRLSPSVSERLPSRRVEGLSDSGCGSCSIDSKKGWVMAKHVDHVRQVLTLLRKNSFYASLKKCVFMTPKVLFCGYVVSDEGIQVDESTTEVANSNSTTEVQSFHGFASFYRRSIPNFSSIMAPLTNCMKGKSFVWTEEAESAFQVVKEKLTTSPILVLPDFSKVFELHTDASKVAIREFSVKCVQLGQKPDFNIHDGFPFKGNQLCIPDTSLHLKIIKELHGEGHVGRDRTLQLVQAFYFWPNMRKEVDRYIKRCRIFQAWDQKLCQAEFAHNHAVNRSIGFSPFQVVYSAQLLGPLDLMSLPVSSSIPKKVFKKIGPLEIVKKINSSAYPLNLPSHIRCSDFFNVKHLLPYHDDSSDDDLVMNSRANFVYLEGNDVGPSVEERVILFLEAQDRVKKKPW